MYVEKEKNHFILLPSFFFFFYNILSNIFVYKVSNFHGILKIFNKKYNVNIKHV